MKILMVSSYLPYPLFSGGHIRLYNILKLLSEKHQITLICEKRDWQTEEDVLEVKKVCEHVETVERKKQWTVPNIIKTEFSLSSFLVVGHTNKDMKKKIKKALDRENFDLIHIETFYVMQNMPKTDIPIVLVEHNIEYLVYQRFANMAPIFVQPLLYLDVLKLKYRERYFWQKATKLVVVSEAEKKFIKRKDVALVPNGVDIEKFKVQSLKFKVQGNERRILFIGDFKWLENRDAAEWILKEIWPEISAKCDMKLWIVGKKIPDSIKKLTNNENVIFDENAPNETSEIFRQADLLLAPIRVGGGTSFKILEAMASGTPVVTTRLGIEGIEAKNNEEVLIADDKEGLSDLVVEVIQNEVLYKKIAQKARLLVEEKYDWKVIVKKLEEVYKSTQ